MLRFILLMFLIMPALSSAVFSLNRSIIPLRKFFALSSLQLSTENTSSTQISNRLMRTRMFTIEEQRSHQLDLLEEEKEGTFYYPMPTQKQEALIRDALKKMGVTHHILVRSMRPDCKNFKTAHAYCNNIEGLIAVHPTRFCRFNNATPYDHFAALHEASHVLHFDAAPGADRPREECEKLADIDAFNAMPCKQCCIVVALDRTDSFTNSPYISSKELYALIKARTSWKELTCQICKGSIWFTRFSLSIPYINVLIWDNLLMKLIA